MKHTRRSFFRITLASGALAPSVRGQSTTEDLRATYARLDEAAAKPVLQIGSLAKPVKIASMELLRNRRNFLVRVHAVDGAEGIGVPNAMHMVHTYPIFLTGSRRSLLARTPAILNPRSGSFTATPTITSIKASRSGCAWRPLSSPYSTCSAT